MSNLTYFHKELKQHLINGKIVTNEERIIEGPKGLTIKMYSKNENSEEKIIISGSGDNYKFTSNIKINNNEPVKEEQQLTKSEMLKVLKNNKMLKFASDFLKTQKGGVLLNKLSKSKNKSKQSKSNKLSKSKKTSKTKKKSKRTNKTKK